MQEREYQVCNNCVMDTTDSLIRFDEKGVCDHCNNYYRNILPNWTPNEIGARELEIVIDRIKKYGTNRKYDCIVGVSGGLDSSYLAYMAIEKWGLRPLLLYVDTGWNLEVAENNVDKLASKLNVGIHKVVINRDEMRDLQLAFLKSQIASQDVQDHAIFATLYNTAVKNEIKYVLTGSNISTECIREPVEWAYANDLRNIKDIHRRFGTMSLKAFPTCSMFKYRIYYRYFKGMKVVKPLDLIPYTREGAIAELEEKFGWERYVHKHYENLFTRFFEGHWLIKKFGFDKRKAHYSSLVVTGQMTREEALELLKQPPYDEVQALEDLKTIASRLGITTEEFVDLMNEPNKSYTDYKNNGALIRWGIGLAKLVGLETRNFR